MNNESQALNLKKRLDVALIELNGSMIVPASSDTVIDLVELTVEEQEELFDFLDGTTIPFDRVKGELETDDN